MTTSSSDEVVIGPLIVAVHVNGNPTVGVIPAVTAVLRAQRAFFNPRSFDPMQRKQMAAGARVALLAGTSRRRDSATPTVEFPFTCTATIKGPITPTITTIVHG